MITEVYCTLQIEGTHNWPTCPFDEVDYLRYPHRHMFHIKAYKQVFHNDRDVEFIMLKHEIESFIRNEYGNINEPRKLVNFGPMSCEMIAFRLIEVFGLTRCEVNEDNENGAILTMEQPSVLA